jgi:hypothetical protein
MGFFDKLFAASGTQPKKPIINNEQEAFLTILAAAGSADGDIEAEEWDTIYDTLFQKKVFNGCDIWALIDECKGNIKGYESMAQAVSDCAPHISAENKEMVFAVCADLVLIDGIITPNEQAIVEHLKGQLSVSDELAMIIVQAMLVRNMGNN